MTRMPFGLWLIFVAVACSWIGAIAQAIVILSGGTLP